MVNLSEVQRKPCQQTIVNQLNLMAYYNSEVFAEFNRLRATTACHAVTLKQFKSACSSEASGNYKNPLLHAIKNVMLG